MAEHDILVWHAGPLTQDDQGTAHGGWAVCCSCRQFNADGFTSEDQADEYTDFHEQLNGVSAE